MHVFVRHVCSHICLDVILTCFHDLSRFYGDKKDESVHFILISFIAVILITQQADINRLLKFTSTINKCTVLNN